MNEAERTNETASITATILEEEEARKAALAEETAVTVLPDDLLPGVGDDEMTFREGVEKGGISMALVLLILSIVEEFDRVAITVLGPDIQDSLNISDTMLLGLGSFGGVVLVLSTIPFACHRIWVGGRVPVITAYIPYFPVIGWIRRWSKSIYLLVSCVSMVTVARVVDVL